MKKRAILTLATVLASTAMMSSALALGPQPEPPDRQVKTMSLRSGDSKIYSTGAPTPIPAVRSGKVKIK
jgi:hypothetical protein